MKKHSLKRDVDRLAISRTNLVSIKPFFQQPSSHLYGREQGGNSQLRATELFSRFTADIIKADVAFTR